MRVASLLVLTVIAAVAQPRMLIRTESGDIEVMLDERRAPRTVANFLKYVDAGLYTEGRFHRTVRTRPDNQPQSNVKIDVIQAGARTRDAFPPIPLERTSATGLRHVDGAISMARDGPDSATSDFFICIGDQHSLDFGGKRNPDGQGFAVFGRVTKGMDVVQSIHRSNAEGQTLRPTIRIVSIMRKPAE